MKRKRRSIHRPGGYHHLTPKGVKSPRKGYKRSKTHGITVS